MAQDDQNVGSVSHPPGRTSRGNLIRGLVWIFLRKHARWSFILESAKQIVNCRETIRLLLGGAHQTSFWLKLSSCRWRNPDVCPHFIPFQSSEHAVAELDRVQPFCGIPNLVGSRYLFPVCWAIGFLFEFSLVNGQLIGTQRLNSNTTLKKNFQDDVIFISSVCAMVFCFHFLIPFWYSISWSFWCSIVPVQICLHIFVHVSMFLIVFWSLACCLTMWLTMLHRWLQIVDLTNRQ